MTTIALCLDDTAQELGLRFLLRDYFNIEAAVFDLPDEAADTATTLYIVSPRCFAANIDFFTPRRARCVTAAPGGPGVDLAASESELIDHLGVIVKGHESNHADDISGAGLSSREIEVLKLVAAGMINKEIADTLNISVNTVLSHRKNITSKLGIKSVSGLSVYAIMNGYIKEHDLRR